MKRAPKGALLVRKFSIFGGTAFRRGLGEPLTAYDLSFAPTELVADFQLVRNRSTGESERKPSPQGEGGRRAGFPETNVMSFGDSREA